MVDSKPEGVADRGRKRLRVILVIVVLAALLVVGITFGNQNRTASSNSPTLSDFYPCLDAKNAQLTLKAGGVPSQAQFEAIVATGMDANNAQIRRGAAQLKAALAMTAAQDAGLHLVEGIGSVLMGCDTLKLTTP
jgi:hypothetical protein